MHTQLPSLQILNIRLCPKLESFPEEGLPSSLNLLEIYYCEKLMARRLGWGLRGLPSLRSHCIRGKFEISESFPERELLPSSLTSLEIWNNSLLKSLNGDELLSYCTKKTGDWLLPKSSFHARRGSANISIFPECQEMSIAKKSVPKGERGRLVQDSSRTSHQN